MRRKKKWARGRMRWSVGWSRKGAPVGPPLAVPTITLRGPGPELQQHLGADNCDRRPPLLQLQLKPPSLLLQVALLSQLSVLLLQPLLLLFDWRC